MSDDIATPEEFDAMIQRVRAETKERREQEDARLADLIERFYARGRYAPPKRPDVEVHDFKQAGANDR
jgi:hypothetical protein